MGKKHERGKSHGADSATQSGARHTGLTPAERRWLEEGARDMTRDEALDCLRRCPDHRR